MLLEHGVPKHMVEELLSVTPGFICLTSCKFENHKHLYSQRLSMEKVNKPFFFLHKFLPRRDLRSTGVHTLLRCGDAAAHQ